MKKVEQLTKRLDHSVPDKSATRCANEVDIYKKALDAYVSKRKQGK